MSLNFLNAFTYLFKEKNWFVKMLIGSLLFFFIKIIAFSLDIFNSDVLPGLSSNLLNLDYGIGKATFVLFYFGTILLVLLSIWMFSTVIGYITTTIRRYMRNQEDAIPDWDNVMGKLFKRGFKFIIACFVTATFLQIFAVLVKKFFMFWFAISPYASFAIITIGAFVFCYYLVLTPALIMSFCEEDRLVAMFNLVKARRFLLKSPKNYALMLFMLIFVKMIMWLCVFALFQAKIGILLLPIACFYLFLVLGHIIGQYYVAFCKE